MGMFMDTDDGPRIAEVTPGDAWKILSQDTSAAFVDVRTRPEWGFVGGPDLSPLGHEVIRLEWKSWPDMSPNPAFAGALLDRFETLPSRILFMCRSGVRSMDAACAVADALSGRPDAPELLNVAEGFEGDLDAAKKRGGLNGWKARGLAWCQT